jgi:hypothetical protein
MRRKRVLILAFLSTGLEGVEIPSRIPGIESSRISEVPFGLIRTMLITTFLTLFVRRGI